jgi:AraC-like DNA-binding protein
VQHVEFFHRDHFAYNYHRKKASRELGHYIDFFWETDFDHLYSRYPEGFSDALFPNVGYTYLINLGTPFVMQLEEKSFELRSDGFLPRHKYMICHHAAGNRIFGIKFNVSPVILEKKVNFSEYREYIFPLAYLIDRELVAQLKAAPDFKTRVKLATGYYRQLVERYAGAQRQVEVVTQVLKEAVETQRFDEPVEALAARYDLSSRTLQRYFTSTTSISSKQALQILRIRTALEQLTGNRSAFRFSDFGYYDYSHFYRHLRSFVDRHTISILQPHLKLLRGGEEVPDEPIA